MTMEYSVGHFLLYQCFQIIILVAIIIIEKNYIKMSFVSLPTCKYE